MSVGFLDKMIQLKAFRKWAIRKAEKELFDLYVVKNELNLPRKVQEIRAYALSNFIHAVNKALETGLISPKVRHAVVQNLVGNLLIGEKKRVSHFREKYGHNPPTFITISPTKVCNLQCTGCYAGSSATDKDTLSFTVLDKILTDKRDNWGSYFTVISGGEPFMYKSEGKTIFDVFEKHRNNYFMVYTNSTLIDREAAHRLAELGNVSPSISVEGWEAETDARRGKGTYKKIQQAIDNLREVGVPFGISFTATKENAHILMDNEFIDYYFDERGAIYGWIFQYMPIGRSYTVDLMVTPEQRKQMLEREMEMIYKDRRFLIDFWNGGIKSVGCISSAKDGGYFYIDWNGNVTPCVFFPYSVMNVNEMYAQGKTLSDAVHSGFFASLREWQDGYIHNGTEFGNLFRPCPIRDHHREFRKIINEYDPLPIDPDAAKALTDKEYERRMINYGAELQELMDPVWKEKVFGIKEGEEDLKDVEKRYKKNLAAKAG
jgi:MoaA/NifB/PqqE/SkfB family radical SAM enzyme